MGTFKVFSTLKNGAVILDIKKVMIDYRIVLCSWRNEFVTWTLDPLTGNVFSGHYYKTIEGAMKDFKKRI
jgi:hypothetical protein